MEKMTDSIVKIKTNNLHEKKNQEKPLQLRDDKLINDKFLEGLINIYIFVLTKGQLGFGMPLFLLSFLFCFPYHNSWALVKTTV